jgi:4-diphosphocytidyl-2-C-methyl-D-erythritol kinase
MVTFPRAKINIGLFITEKRGDGYHNIESLFAPVGLSDALEFVEAGDNCQSDELTVTGVMAGCNPADNFVMKALEIVRRKRTIPYQRIHLHKAIPAGSGLGGGSSDASAMLLALNKRYSVGYNAQDLHQAALSIGSDCPFFINCAPVIATGRGELFEPAPPLPSGLKIVIVHDGIHISTPEAYANCTPRRRTRGLRELISQPLSEWRESITNDFEEYAFRRFPRLAEIKESLYVAGAVYSSMSGSGSAVYGLFVGDPDTHVIKGNIIYCGNFQVEKKRPPP